MVFDAMVFDAVVLAGGAGTRLGGADKAGLIVGGVRLLDRVLSACAAARHTVVVGAPRPASRMVEWTLEQPPGGGPLAGLAAGVAVLERVTAPAPVLVLATDLARLAAADVDRLLAALGSDCDAAVFVDREGRAQPLAAVYHRDRLSRALAGLAPVAGRPMRALLGELTVTEVPDRGASADIDTPGQLAAARTARTDGGTTMDLDEWAETVCRATGADRSAVDVAAILDLAKDAAHGVARPAAPLTTFLAGWLAGRAAAGGADPAAAAQAAIDEVGALIPAPPNLDPA